MIQLPENYLPVDIRSLNNKYIGSGILNRGNDIHSLYLFTERDGVIIYTKNEIKENFILLNPDDGCEYDLRKVM